jgi:hypothetical protein
MIVGEQARRPADAAETSRGAAPVIVMAYAGAGADKLRALLSSFPGLACTTGTGILPLCHYAVTAWQTVDKGAYGGLSPLAAASVRALNSGLVMAILAREGGRRWCEFTSASPAATGTFLRIYPHTQFLILHRRADATIRAVLDANPWGLAGAEFAPFVSASPASTVAAVANYWAAHTAELLDFEEAHPGSCLRVRIEDVNSNASQALLDIGGFLSLDRYDVVPAVPQDTARDPVAGDLPGLLATAPVHDQADGIPLPQLPRPLQARLSELHRRLGYSPVAVTGA